jgi:pilus assembly protein FimV
MASRDKIIAKAEKLVSKGKIEDAIAEYDRLLKDSPNDVNTLNRIGDLWVRINRTSEAVGVFTRIADQYSRDGFFLKAIAIYKKINKLDPSRLEIYEKLAELYAKQGLAMEAKSQYLVLADFSIKQGNTPAALNTYRKISELDPNSINVHVKLADLYQQNGQKDEALKEYDRVGRLLLRKGMFDEAVQVFQKAIKIDATNVELVSSLVNALNEAGQHDKAIQILETARTASPDEPRLAALLGKVLAGKGNFDEARSVLEEAVAVAPDDPAAREALAEIYLKKGSVEEAFQILLPRVDALIRSDAAAAALALLNKVLEVDSTHTGSLEKTVEAHIRANQETYVLSSMSSLAEAHLARGTHEQAAEVLRQLIDKEPENAQHRKKLGFVEQQMGITPTVEVEEPAPPAPPEDLSLDQPDEIHADRSEETSASADFDFGLPPSVLPPPEPEPAPAPEVFAPESDEDITFVTEHMTESEVFAKYGLFDRAIDHLKKVIDRSPGHIPAYDRLFELYLEEGQPAAAGDLAGRYIDLLRRQDEHDKAEAVENELASRGIALPSAAAQQPEAVDEGVAAEETGSVTIEASGEEVSFGDLDFGQVGTEEEMTLELETEGISVDMEEADEEISMDLEEADEELSMDFEEAAEEISMDLEEVAAEIPAETSEPVVEISTGMEQQAEEIAMAPEEQREEVSADDAVPPATLPEAEEEGILESISFDSEDASTDEGIGLDFDSEEGPSLELEPELPEPIAEAEAGGGPAGVAPPAAPSDEELSEIDFYIEQELFSEARERLVSLAENSPHDPGVVSRLEKLEQKAASTESEQPPALDIEAELLAAIPEDEEAASPPPEALAPPPAAPAPEVSEEDEEGLFADEEDFFDLAAELEAELEGELGGDLSLSEEEQSLEDVFREFKKGVEEQLDAEDHDTHYNLGIAYKEMGLIDEAIGEFQIASKDPKRAVECCSMLGLCFLEKGMPQLAIKWYTKGIEVPEITEEEHMGLLYELGNAHLEVGGTAQAHKTFIEIYGINSTYRDVAERIRQLENVASD